MKNLFAFLRGRRSWEYLDYFFAYGVDRHVHEARIAGLGKDGWELVCIQHNTATFKRMK